MQTRNDTTDSSETDQASAPPHRTSGQGSATASDAAQQVRAVLLRHSDGECLTPLARQTGLRRGPLNRILKSLIEVGDVIAEEREKFFGVTKRLRKTYRLRPPVGPAPAEPGSTPENSRGHENGVDAPGGQNADPLLQD